MSVTEARRELTTRANELRKEGLTVTAIGRVLGVSRTYADDLVNDPDGAKARARKDSYRGTCEGCGAPTDGSNGRARAPKRCLQCAAEPTPLAERFWAVARFGMRAGNSSR